MCIIYTCTSHLQLRHLYVLLFQDPNDEFGQVLLQRISRTADLDVDLPHPTSKGKLTFQELEVIHVLTAFRFSRSKVVVIPAHAIHCITSLLVFAEGGHLHLEAEEATTDWIRQPGI